jgi:hypothetical protein
MESTNTFKFAERQFSCGTVSLEDLRAHFPAICEGILHNGEVWKVTAGEFDPDFVLGPERICGRVLGLYDVEYGWPEPVLIDGEFDLHDLIPGNRRHPILMKNGKCVAVAVHLNEFHEIVNRFGGS